jgi:hypothetical protein
MDGPTYDASIARTNHVAASLLNTGAAAVYGGVLPSGGAMAVTAGSGMSVNVATGYCAAPATATTSGGYLFGLMSAASLTVATSDPSNPRIDIVCATVTDLGTSSSTTVVQVVTGTAAPSPAAPALPATSVLLAQVLVPAASTSVASGNVTDERLFTTAQGGILPYSSATSVAPSGYTGMYAHDAATGRLVHNGTSGPAQPHILPQAPVQAYASGAPGTTVSGGLVTVTALSFTADGVTDWVFEGSWPGLWSSASSAFYADIYLTLDSATLTDMLVRNDSTSSTGAGG